MPRIILNIKQEIIKNAFEILKEEEYSNFSIRNIAKRCNIGTGTVYNYFASKEDIIMAIADFQLELVLNEINDNVKKDEASKDKVRKIFNIVHKKFIEIADEVLDKVPYMMQSFLERDIKSCGIKLNKHEDICMTKVYEVLKDKLDVSDSFTLEVILRIISWYAKYENDEFENVWSVVCKLI